MSDPSDLHAARQHLILSMAALVRYARMLPEGLDRDSVRHAIREVANALIRIYPTPTVEAAQAHALHTLNLRPRADEPLEISGLSVELYAAELVTFFMAHGETTGERVR